MDLSPEALLNQDLDGVNQWPSFEHSDLQELKPTCDAYYQACLELSQTLVRALAQVIPCGNATYFEKAFDHHSSFLRLNYYPVLVDGVDAGAVPQSSEENDGYVLSPQWIIFFLKHMILFLQFLTHTDLDPFLSIINDIIPYYLPFAARYRVG